MESVWSHIIDGLILITALSIEALKALYYKRGAGIDSNIRRLHSPAPALKVSTDNKSYNKIAKVQCPAKCHQLYRIVSWILGYV